MADSSEDQSKLVLVCFKKQKRSVRFNSNEAQCDSEVLVKRIKEEFKDCLPATNSHCEMFFQVKDENWNEFVDVVEGDETEDKSVVQVIVDEVSN